MDKLLIVDGHNLLFQMFYGMPSRIIDKDGKPIQGVLGFVGALLKIIKMAEPSHVVVLFDGEHENLRSALNPEYKSNRPDYSEVDEVDNPFSQLDYIYRSLEVLNIAYFEEDKYEVDDIIASYAYRYGGQARIVISSFDSDYFQLINKNVSVLRYRGKNTVICDEAYILERFGILPEFYADFKSLTGDTSDNIKGAEMIGNKTAMKLINEFGNIEKIISHSDQIASERVRNSIINNEQRIKNNFQLIKLIDIGKIPFDFDELAYTYNGLTTNQVLMGIGLIIN
ncbi:MAG: flap endonuclease [Clostridia bacterium]|nr:flap endonuclease [Clostridia bacterium]